LKHFNGIRCGSTPFADISDLEKPTLRKKLTCGKFTKSRIPQVTFFTKVGFFAKSTNSASNVFLIHKLIAEKSDLVNFPQVTFFRKVGFFQVTYIRKRGLVVVVCHAKRLT